MPTIVNGNESKTYTIDLTEKTFKCQTPQREQKSAGTPGSNGTIKDRLNDIPSNGSSSNGVGSLKTFHFRHPPQNPPVSAGDSQSSIIHKGDMAAGRTSSSENIQKDSVIGRLRMSLTPTDMSSSKKSLEHDTLAQSPTKYPRQAERQLEPSLTATRLAQRNKSETQERSVMGTAATPAQSVFPEIVNIDVDPDISITEPLPNDHEMADYVPFTRSTKSASPVQEKRSIDNLAPGSNDSSLIPLTLPAIRNILRHHITELQIGHEYYVKTLLSRSRQSCKSRTSKPQVATFIQNLSPFAEMAGLQSSSSIKSDRQSQVKGTLAQVLGAKGNLQGPKLTIPCTPYKSTAVVLPPFTHYISSKRNLLTEDEKHTTYFPYHGDDAPMNHEDVDFENRVSSSIFRFQTRNALAERARLHVPDTCRFLEEIGCEFSDILRYLLDETSPSVPISMDEEATRSWLDREANLQEDYYYSDDDEGQDEISNADTCSADAQGRIKRRPWKWLELFEGLPPSKPRAAAVAGLACAAFLRETGFSLWHIAKTYPIEFLEKYESVQDIASASMRSSDVHSKKPNPLGTYTDFGCLVCFAHECPGHGEFTDEDGIVNARLRVNSKPLSPTAASNIGLKRSRSLSASEVYGLNDDGTVSGLDEHDVTVLDTGFADDELCSATCFWRKSNRINTKAAPWSNYDVELLRAMLPAYNQNRRAACFIRFAIQKPCAEIFFEMRKPTNRSRDFKDVPVPRMGKSAGTMTNATVFILIVNAIRTYAVLDPVNRYRDDFTKGKCANVFLQRGVPKRTLLGDSKLLKETGFDGWGLYMGEPVRNGDYLGEYVGEVVSNEEAERRGIIYNRRNTSYLFDLNRKQTLDSTRIGNKFRYVNHQAPPYANCKAKVLFCNTVHRIGMFALRNIDVGEELLFDYGPGFTEQFVAVKLRPNAPPILERPQKGVASKKQTSKKSIGTVLSQPRVDRLNGHLHGRPPGRPTKNLATSSIKKSQLKSESGANPSPARKGAQSEDPAKDESGSVGAGFDGAGEDPAEAALPPSEEEAAFTEHDAEEASSSEDESYHGSEGEDEDMDLDTLSATGGRVPTKREGGRSGMESWNPQKRGWITRRNNMKKSRLGVTRK